MTASEFWFADVYGVCGEFDRLDTVFGDGSVSGRGTADSESYMEGCSVFSDADAEEASHDLSGAMDDSVDATQTSNEEFRVEGKVRSILEFIPRFTWLSILSDYKKSG